jgi:RNA polymerase sigma-70 factor (ECF subfamily)
MTDERELYAQLKDPKTQRAAFGVIVRQYSEQLYWQIRRIVLTHEDANDVMQNTFMKAWNHIDSFQGESKIITWLSRIAINESLDHLRRNNHTTVSTEDDLSLVNALQADPYFDGSEVEAMLQQAVATLPDVQRTVFQLRYFDEMKYSEMSQVLNTSEGSLKASYHIAVKKIAEFFKSRD